MKTPMILAISTFILAAIYPGFDYKAALWVGGVTAIGAGLVITAAVLTPFIAISAPLTLGGILALGGISVAVGAAAGIVAGYYKGAENEREKKVIIEKVNRHTKHLHIFFLPSKENPLAAEDFKCTLSYLKEINKNNESPNTEQILLKISADSPQEFNQLLKTEIEKWLLQPTLADSSGEPRVIHVYMKPTPGDGTYQSIKNLIDKDLGKLKYTNLTREDSEPPATFTK